MPLYLRKNLLTIVLLCCLNALSAQQFVRIEFDSRTRGYQESVVFEKSTVHIVVNSIGEKKDTTFAVAKKDWIRLQSLVKSMRLKDMPNWKSSGQGRATDRARASTITIVTKTSSYTSATFDNHDAPKKLLPIVELVKKLTKGVLPD